MAELFIGIDGGGTGCRVVVAERHRARLVSSQADALAVQRFAAPMGDAA